MGFYEEYIEPLRRQLLQKLGFTAELSPEQYALTYRACPDETEELLDDMGFTRNPIAWLKMHSIFGVAEGSWAKRESLFAENQLHVTLQRGTTEECVTHVFAHWEKNWIRHPLKHLFEIDYSAEEGVARTENLLRAHVDEDKLEYIEI